MKLKLGLVNILNFKFLYQLFLLLSREKSFTKIHLFLIASFPNISQYDLTSATFNELKNYNSSSLMPSLLFVFEVKVDYVEGNSRMIIYNNYVEVPQLCKHCAWQRKGEHNLYFIYNFCTYFNQEPVL